jgi:hypothetical protein
MVVKRTPNRPTPRVAAGPTDDSRGAGPAAVASLAASAPMKDAFYNEPGDGGAAAPSQFATVEHQFAARVRTESVDMGSGMSADRETAEAMAVEAIDDPALLRQEIERIRSIRRPLGAYSQKLALSERRGYKRHWFNDQAGRPVEAESNGWAFVKGSDNKPIKRCVGSGRDKGALYAYAMEIPLEFWQEDMASKNKVAQDALDSLKKTPFRAAPGASKPADSGKFYDPTESAGGPLTIERHTT